MLHVHMHMHMRHAHVLSNVQCAMCMYVWGFTHFLRGYGIRYLVFRFGILGAFFSRPRLPRAGGPWPAARFFAFFDTLHFSMYTTLFYVVYPCYPLSRSRKRACQERRAPPTVPINTTLIIRTTTEHVL